MSALFQMMVYFDQDWVDYYPSARAAVDAYLAEFPAESIRQALAELRALLARNMSEKELDHYLGDELGCNYYTAADELTASQWLWIVVEQMEDWLKKHPIA